MMVHDGLALKCTFWPGSDTFCGHFGLAECKSSFFIVFFSAFYFLISIFIKQEDPECWLSAFLSSGQVAF